MSPRNRDVEAFFHRVSANDARTIAGIFSKNGKAEVECFVNADVTIQKVYYDGFLYYSSILNIMRQSKARQKMIFADACYAGKMRSTNKRNPWRHQGKQVSTTASSLSFWNEACEAGLT